MGDEPFLVAGCPPRRGSRLGSGNVLPQPSFFLHHSLIRKGSKYAVRRAGVQPYLPRLTCQATLDKSFLLCGSQFPLWANSSRQTSHGFGRFFWGAGFQKASDLRGFGS